MNVEQNGGNHLKFQELPSYLSYKQIECKNSTKV